MKAAYVQKQLTFRIRMRANGGSLIHILDFVGF